MRLRHGMSKSATAWLHTSESSVRVRATVSRIDSNAWFDGHLSTGRFNGRLELVL